MTEEFLHYIWQFRLLPSELILKSGEAIHVLYPGDPNSDSGPDFFNARVWIGNTLWAGNVEIHIKSSDWFRHSHDTNQAYDSIVLHVVYRDDEEIIRRSGAALPTLELIGYIDEQMWRQYLQFMSSHAWIPCENMLGSVPAFIWISWLESLVVERLQRKTREVESVLESSSGDWNQAFYRLLASNMGFKLNSDAFSRLANSLSYRHLAKHADNLFQVEAMVYGQAGLLAGTFRDHYPNQLKKEYEFLQKKFSLVSLDAHIWRFMRLHPGNFPTIRLSQFSGFIHRTNGFLMDILESADIESLQQLFRSEVSEYWRTHYCFDKPAKNTTKKLGKAAIDLLVINLVVPFLFVYGQRKGGNPYIEKSLDFIARTKGENNTITRRWKRLGVDVSSASHTQALLELKSRYCDQKKCLSCRIGNKLLNRSITGS